MQELQYLDLSHNVINSMHEDVFVDIKKIKFLDVSHNNLVQVRMKRGGVRIREKKNVIDFSVILV